MDRSLIYCLVFTLTLTFDLGLEFPASYGHDLLCTPTCMQRKHTDIYRRTDEADCILLEQTD